MRGQRLGGRSLGLLGRGWSSCRLLCGCWCGGRLAQQAQLCCGPSGLLLGILLLLLLLLLLLCLLLL
jgi:hypothetical protein